MLLSTSRELFGLVQACTSTSRQVVADATSGQAALQEAGDTGIMADGRMMAEMMAESCSAILLQ